jgi:enterochelin esterase-like enzyme
MRLKFAAGFLFLSFTVLAQPPAAPGQPGQAPGAAPGAARGAAGRGMMGGMQGVRSPEILPDNKVTFRYRAPNAAEVLLNGTWPEGRGVKMTKDDQGVWSVTTGPLTPELWAYTFGVDGATALDGSNANVQRDGSRYSSFLIIDGPLSANYSIKDVPHGNVNMVWYNSPTLKLNRRMFVYTPPEYTSSKAKFPVLYLLHRAGGDEDAWKNMGSTSVTLDNLIAAGKAKPMLVVMTNGNANQKMGPGYGTVPGQNTAGAFGNPGEMGGRFAAPAAGRGAAPGAPGAAPAAPGAPPAAAAGAGRGAAAAPGAPGATPGAGRGPSGPSFPESIVADVIPYIEKNYRVIPNKDGRAVMGLSMGGGHTLTVTNAHPATFSYIGVLSMGTREDITDKLQAIRKAGVKFYYVGCGQADTICVEGSKNLDTLLTKVGIKHQFTFNSGGHTWANWRIYLNEYAPMMFK